MSTSEGSRNWTMSNQAFPEESLSHPLKYASSGSYLASPTASYHGDYSSHHTTPYRWTPCPEWEQTGRCKYNDTCYRRHGPEDQRIVPQGWEKKRSHRSSSTSSHGSSQSGGAISTGVYSNGASNSLGNQPSSHMGSSQHQQGQWVPRQGSTAPKPATPNATKYGAGAMGTPGYHQQHSSVHHSGAIPGANSSGSSQYHHHTTHHSSGSNPNLDSVTLSLSRVSVGSPEYDSDQATSPTILSPGVLSPTITSPNLSHRMSLSSSPRDSYDSHPVPVAEKPWIWQPCRHWQDSGSCRYGDSCKYRHGPEDRRERPAPRPTAAHASAHALMRSTSNSSMESLGAFSTADSLVSASRPNISLQPIGAQITSPNASMGSLPPFHVGNGMSSSHHSLPGSGNVIWDLFSPAVGRLSPPLGEDSAMIMQAFGEHLRNICVHHPDSADLQSELNSIHIQAMITIQLQRENFLPPAVQDPMRVLLQSIAISSNPHEWQFALVKVLDFLNALLDHLFNKFVSVSISSPSSSFGTLPVDIPSKLSLVQPYIGGRLSGSISELYDLGSRAQTGIFAPSQEEVITILEQLRRVAASTSKSV